MARTMARGGLAMLAAVVCVLASGSARAAQDTDGDGFPDVIEQTLGSDPSLATSTPTGSPANVQPFNAGVFVTLGFQQNDSLVVSMDLSALPATLEGKRVAYAIGGVAACVTLDANGTGSDPFTDSNAAAFSAEGFTNVQISTFGNLAGQFADEGLTSDVTTLKSVKVDAIFFFDDVLYVNSQLNGIYQVTTPAGGTAVGQAFFNFQQTDPKTNLSLSNILVTPNPANIGDTVSIDLDLKAKGLKLDNVSGTIDFGDGTPAQSLDSATIAAPITHTYNANGVFKITIAILAMAPGAEGSSTTLVVDGTAFAVVGTGAAINSANGLVSTANIVAGTNSADVNFSINSLEDPSVTGASTTFEELDGLASQPAAQGISRDTTEGLFPTRTVLKPGLTVAKTETKNSSNQSRGTTRKTVAVGSRNATPANSANPKPPKVKAGVVTVSKVSGKFIFSADSSKNKPDQVTFSGEIVVPEGFSPESPDGIRFAIGMGNVLDGVMLDAKGKPKLTGGDNSRLKKVSVKFPKLSGPATGMEVAKISVTMSTQDMDLKGFESEGITNRVRDDEAGRKAVPRFMQLSVMLAGEPYEAYVPVEFKLSSKADAGTMASRKSR